MRVSVSQQGQSLTESLNQKLTATSKLAEKKYRDVVRYVFDINKVGFILPEDTVSELIERPKFTFIPKMPSLVEGLCNVRGTLVPVFNLHKYFNIEKEANHYLLVIGEGENVVGVLLDELPYLLEEEHLQELNNIPQLPRSLESYTSKAFYLGDKILIEYNHEDFYKSLSQ